MMKHTPLQNRVLPDARIVSEPWLGMFMGNRGGRIHDPATRTLLKRKWASKRWIICLTQFKNRKRTVMGESYTELFFMDEVSALATGHRPCFECQRKVAKAFALHWKTCFGPSPQSQADAMDKVLHQERMSTPGIVSLKDAANLPSGAMLMVDGTYFAKRQNGYLQWSGAGYAPARLPGGTISLLTPPSILAVLQSGYQPVWHESAH